MKIFDLTADAFHMKGNFKGKMTRSDFWLFLLFSYLLLAFVGILLGVISLLLKSPGVMQGFFVAVLLNELSMPAARARRLHDVGKSGWWQLVPFYNLYLFLKPSSEIGSISALANYESN